MFEDIMGQCLSIIEILRVQWQRDYTVDQEIRKRIVKHNVALLEEDSQYYIFLNDEVRVEKMKYSDRILEIEKKYYQKFKEKEKIDSPWQRDIIMFVALVLTGEISFIFFGLLVLSFCNSDIPEPPQWVSLFVSAPVLVVFIVDKVMFNKYWDRYNKLRLITLDEVIEEELKIDTDVETPEGIFIKKKTMAEEYVSLYTNRIEYKTGRFGIELMLAIWGIFLVLYSVQLENQKLTLKELIIYIITLVILNTGFGGWINKKIKSFDKDYFLKLIDDDYPAYIRERFIMSDGRKSAETEYTDEL